MARFRGMGWRELIKSPEYYAQQTKKALSPIISKLAAVANKRLKRLEESGISYSNYEGPDAISGVRKFGAKNKSLGELRSEYKRLQGFLESPISTITGRKEEYFQAKSRLWEYATKETREKLGEKPTRKAAYKEYERAKKKYREEKKRQEKQQDESYFNWRDIDPTEIFDAVSKLFQAARQEGWRSKSDKLMDMRPSMNIRYYFQEMVIDAYAHGITDIDSIIEFVRDDLGVDSIREEEPSSRPSTSSFF